MSDRLEDVLLAALEQGAIEDGLLPARNQTAMKVPDEFAQDHEYKDSLIAALADDVEQLTAHLQRMRDKHYALLNAAARVVECLPKEWTLYDPSNELMVTLDVLRDVYREM